MKPWAIAAATVMVVVLAGGAIFYLNSPAPGGTQFTTSSGQEISNTTSVDGLNGLQLRLGTNATSLPYGGGLQVSVSEYNTEATMNNVSSANNWPVDGLSLGACGHLSYPFGFAVFQGYYNSVNVSQAQPLQIYPPTPCPMLLRLVTGYLFEPLNDSAVIQPGSGATLMWTNATVIGTFNDSLQAFNPGVYTLAAGDEWGALAVFHFSVTGHVTPSSGAPMISANGTLVADLTFASSPGCSASATTAPAGSPYSSYGVVMVPQAADANVTSSVNWISNGCSISGSVQVSLPAGNYTIVLTDCPPSVYGSALPRSFAITTGQTTDVSVLMEAQ